MTLPRFISRTSLSFAIVFPVLLTALARPATAATLSLCSSSISAGAIAVGQSTTLTCTLTNSGPQVITVFRATSSNSAYTVVSPSFPLSLSSRRRASLAIRFSPKYAARITGTITFASNASDSRLALSLTGTGVQGNLTASLPSASFGTVAEGSEGTLSETLTNSSPSPVTISSVSTSGSAFSRSGIALPLTLPASGRVTFQLLFQPKTAGGQTGSLTVLSNASDSTLTVPLSGTGGSAATLAVSPASANMGSVTVGSSKTMSANLTASGSSVTVSSATTTSPEFTVSGVSFPTTIAAGKTATFTVKFTPNSSGAASGNLSFVSTAANSPAVETLTGTGVASDTASHQAALSWHSSSSSVSGYNIYRGTATGGPYSRVNASLNGGTSYTDSTVTAGDTYYYVVTSVNSEGTESSYSNQVQAVIP